MNEEEFAELSAGYALNALSADDRRAFEQALAEHPDWVSRVRADVDTAAALSDSIPAVAAPRAIRDDLLARISRMPQQDADASPRRDEEDFAAAGVAPVSATGVPARRGRQRWFALAASIVLVAVIGVGAVVVTQQLATPAAVVALEQIENSSDAQSATVELADGGEATAYWSDETGQAVLVSDGLPSLASDETFELWFVRDGEAISAGTFEAESGTVTALLSGEVRAGDLIAVTVEQEGGSSTGQPTTEPIIAIATA